MAVVEPEQARRVHGDHRPLGRRGHRHRRGHRRRPPGHHLARRGHRRRAAALGRPRRARSTTARCARPAYLDALQADGAGSAGRARRPATSCGRRCCTLLGLARTCATSPGSPTSTTATSWATPRSPSPTTPASSASTRRPGRGVARLDRLQRPLRQARPVRRRPARAGRGLPQRRDRRRRAAGRHRLPQLRLAGGPGRHVAVRRGRPRPRRRLPGARHPGHRRQRLASTTRPATSRSTRRRSSACSACMDDVARRTPVGLAATPARSIYLLGATARRARRLASGPTSCTGTSAACRRRSTSTAERLLGEILVNASPRRPASTPRTTCPTAAWPSRSPRRRLRYGVGARIWLDEVCERDGIDPFTALFSESTGARRRRRAALGGGAVHRHVHGPRLRRTPASASSTTDRQALDVQGQFTLPLADLRAAHTATLPAAFGH